MRLIAAVFVAALLAGCQLETPAPAAPDLDRNSAAGESLAVEGPPVVAGDTARVTPSRAGVANPGAVETTEVAPSGLAIPVAGIATDELVDTFTDARSEGRVHNAIDILAPRGTPVVAAVTGEVLRLFTSEKGGLTVYQLGPDERTVYYYAHLDAYAPGLESGQTVPLGFPIGTVGDSGNAAPGNTHLHFAIWRITDRASFWDGESVNPYPLLAGR